MLCGVRSSHAQASVLAVAGIQLAMLVMLVVVWARLSHAREAASMCHVKVGCVSPLWFAVAACLMDARPEYRLPTTFGPRSTASPNT
jgi:hypothetical protein